MYIAEQLPYFTIDYSVLKMVMVNLLKGHIRCSDTRVCRIPQVRNHTEITRLVKIGLNRICNS